MQHRHNKDINTKIYTNNTYNTDKLKAAVQLTQKIKAMAKISTKAKWLKKIKTK